MSYRGDVVLQGRQVWHRSRNMPLRRKLDEGELRRVRAHNGRP